MAAARRVFIGAFGDPGHAFPAISLARALRSMGAGVVVETAEPWRDAVLATGAEFVPAPEFPVFPTLGRHLQPYEAVAQAMETTRPAVASSGADVVVHDILTLAPALSAELEGLPVVTLVPHLNPVTPTGTPPFGLGARMPRTPAGKSLWRALGRPVERGLARGRDEYDELRRRVGLSPRGRINGTLSEDLVLIGTYPQLEASRPRPDHFRVTGPLFWEPEFPEVQLPSGDGPLILVAPSTAQDLGHDLLRAALAGLGGPDLRVIATWNRRPLTGEVAVPANTNLVEWLSYSKTIPHCSAVISHGGHGTVARTLEAGAIPVIVPFSGDQFENAARIDETGLGVRLPRRLLSPATLSLSVERALGDGGMSARAGAVSAWATEHDGSIAAARLILA
ncbi:MAG: nucleotide disphospho-sugar-binding domain-containing protein [Actinomycetes bacterium]